MKLTVAILVEQNKPLAIEMLDMVPLQAGQVLVKILHSGICGKQIDEITGRQGPDKYIPHCMGHEGTATVVEIGPGVRHVKVNDTCVVHWRKGAGIDSAPPRFNLNGKTISAGWCNTFADYMIVSENRLTPIRNDVDMSSVALMGCAVTTGLGIVFNNASVLPGQSIVIFGIGGVGLNVLQGAILVNAYPIVAVDVNDTKIEMAKHFGATHAFNSASERDIKAKLLEISGPHGYDVSVDIVGASSVRVLAYDVTKKTGKTIFAGVPHHQDPVSLHTYPIHMGRQVIGSSGGDTDPQVDIPRYVDLYARNKLNLDDQVTHHFELEKINEAISIVQSGHGGRVVLDLGHA